MGDNDWTAHLGEQRPLCIEDMENLFKQIQEKEIEDDKRMREWGRKMREFRESDPRGYDAIIQAGLECFGRIGDPVNPVITSPKQKERYERRVKQLTDSAEPLPLDPSFDSEK